MAMPEASSTAIISAGRQVLRELTATLPRVAVQVQQQFLDALHAGQAPKGAPSGPNRPGRPKGRSPGLLAWPGDFGITW